MPLPIVFGLLSLAAAKAAEGFSAPSGRRRTGRTLEEEAQEGHIFASSAPPGGRYGVVYPEPNPLTDVVVHIDPATYQIVKGWRTDGQSESHPVEIIYEAPNVDAAGYAVVGIFPGVWRFTAVTLDGKIASTSSAVQLYPGDRIRIEPSAPPRSDPMGRRPKAERGLDVVFL